MHVGSLSGGHAAERVAVPQTASPQSQAQSLPPRQEAGAGAVAASGTTQGRGCKVNTVA